MKNQVIPFLLIISLLFSVFCISVNAYMPQQAFSCDIDNESIPENTAYVDLLFPISEKKEYYTDFNEINGERFGIKKDSEIVNYREDGFMSYTFHLKDARSEMVTDGEFIVWFCDELSPDYPEQIYDYEYCCKEFRYVKIAYIDRDGKVLSVSNKADIYKFTMSDLRVGLTLNGNELTSTISEGPPYWLLPIYLFVLPVLFLVVLVVGTVFLVKHINENQIVGELNGEQVFYNSYIYTEIKDMNSIFVRGRCLGSLNTVIEGKTQKVKIYKVKNQPDYLCVTPQSKFRRWRVFEKL